jgi:transcriptional regulator with XRE-family HTH domain
MNDSLLEEIGLRLKEIRTEVNLSQDDFSIQLDVFQSSISAIEKGQRKISPEIVIKLHEKYEINISWLFTGKGEMRLVEPADESKSELLLRLEEMENEIMEHKILLSRSLENEVKYIKALQEYKKTLQKVTAEKK